MGVGPAKHRCTEGLNAVLDRIGSAWSPNAV